MQELLIPPRRILGQAVAEIHPDHQSRPAIEISDAVAIELDGQLLICGAHEGVLSDQVLIDEGVVHEDFCDRLLPPSVQRVELGDSVHSGKEPPVLGGEDSDSQPRHGQIFRETRQYVDLLLLLRGEVLGGDLPDAVERRGAGVDGASVDLIRNDVHPLFDGPFHDGCEILAAVHEAEGIVRGTEQQHLALAPLQPGHRPRPGQLLGRRHPERLWPREHADDLGAHPNDVAREPAVRRRRGENRVAGVAHVEGHDFEHGGGAGAEADVFLGDGVPA
mmetsp:Transcript_64787/g.193607  ORF Transcript_64787/g.193607 Transcript_64787/m.193607 type:complete len:276 (-) Transcript_64787:438-1265(-)